MKRNNYMILVNDASSLLVVTNDDFLIWCPVIPPYLRNTRFTGYYNVRNVQGCFIKNLQQIIIGPCKQMASWLMFIEYIGSLVSLVVNIFYQSIDFGCDCEDDQHICKWTLLHWSVIIDSPVTASQQYDKSWTRPVRCFDHSDKAIDMTGDQIHSICHDI